MGRLDAAVAAQPPGAFAFVMATGIVSVGLDQQAVAGPSIALLGVAVVGYVVLLAGLGARLARHRALVVADLRDPRRAFGHLTLVAGTGVLAVRLLDVQPMASRVLLGAATLLWLVLGYAVPWSALLSRHRDPVLAGANGTWFVWAVASQSVAVAAAQLEPVVDTGRQGLALLSVLAWSVGIVLYAACAVLVAARLVLHPLGPRDLDPSYWVSMGAAAISVVAGSAVAEMSATPVVEATSALVGGLVVLCWAWATWLVPVLLAVGVWRHAVHRVPLSYESAWWSVVFPLGMYAVAGMALGRADALPVVERIGSWWLWVAVLAWCVAAIVMVAGWVRRRPAAEREAAPAG